jgi:hypothetical protein
LLLYFGLALAFLAAFANGYLLEMALSASAFSIFTKFFPLTVTTKIVAPPLDFTKFAPSVRPSAIGVLSVIGILRQLSWCTLRFEEMFPFS